MDVLKFSAKWCNPCKVLHKALEDAGVLHKVKEIDVEESPELAKKYGVRGLPTTIFLKSEKEEYTRVVGTEIKTILDLINTLEAV